MSSVQLVLLCLLSSGALGDISEKLKQGQGLAAPSDRSSDFSGLLAPFPDRFGGPKGGNALNADRKPIPFNNHAGADDDENNLDRLCNDAFHSFLCKPVGPRRIRLDGKLRAGAKLPPGLLVGSSSNVQIAKSQPLQSGGALLPTELDNEDGYRYPQPTNNVPSGYEYPKPYKYDKPANPLAYPSQVSSAVLKPSNEYLPSLPSTTTTTARPVYTTPKLNSFGSFGSPTNQILSQPAPYQFPKQNNPIVVPPIPQTFTTLNQPIAYTFPQTTIPPASNFPVFTSPASPFVAYSSLMPLSQFAYIPPPTAPERTVIYSGQPSYSISQFSPQDGYLYPKPSNNNPVIYSTPTPVQPVLRANNEYLPPVLPKATNVVYNTIPQSTFRPIISTTFRPPTTALPTTARPITFRTTQRPFIYQTPTTTTAKPISFSFASSNDVRYSAGPSNGYLPPVNQPIPSPANEFRNILPSPRPTTTTTPRAPPSNEYLPVEGSSSNLSPNFEGGSILASEDDGPATPASPRQTTERTHTLEELCRDAFHSFLCKPIDKPRQRISGRLREGAKIPAHVMSALGLTRSGGALLAADSSKQNRYNPYNSIGSAYQPTNLSPQLAAIPSQSQPLFLLSESDSSSLAKQFSKPKLNPVQQTTTSRPSTTFSARKTPPKKAPSTELHKAASAVREPTFASPTGYKYPAPPNPLTPPTTAAGYKYPKPTNPLLTPSSLPAKPSGQTFGQRLPPQPNRANEVDPELPPASQFEILKP